MHFKATSLAFCLCSIIHLTIGLQTGFPQCDYESNGDPSKESIRNCMSFVNISVPLGKPLWRYHGNLITLTLTPNGYAGYGGNLNKVIYFHGDNFCLARMSDKEKNLTVTICESTCCLNETYGKGDRMCIPKCCQMGYILDGTSGDCVLPKNDDWRDQDHALQSVIRDSNERDPNFFYQPDYLICKKLDQPHRVRIYNQEQLHEIINNDHTWRSKQRFCLDIYDSESLPDAPSDGVAAVFMCAIDRNYGWKNYTVANAVTEVFTAGSIVIHSGIIWIHGLLWEHQGCYGWTIMAFSGSQLVFNLAAVVVWTVLKFVEHCSASMLGVCSVAVIALHFSFLATFTWTLLLAFEVWRKLSASSAADSYEVDKVRFWRYCLIGFGTPLPLVITAICVFFPKNPLAEFPDMCKHYVETSAVYYAVIPCLILYSCISIFGVLTLKRLWETSKIRQSLKGRGKSTGRPFYRRVALIWKLMALMGTFLILDILCELWDSSNRYRVYTLRFPIQSFYKLVHAAAQFHIFVCSGRTKVQLLKKYPSIQRYFTMKGLCGRRERFGDNDAGGHELLPACTGSSQEAVSRESGCKL